MRALAAVGGGDKFLGLKIAWDETALRMHLPIEELRRAFPDLTFHEPPPDDPPPADVQSPAAARQPRTKPSHTLQVMQKHVNISVDGELERCTFVRVDPARVDTWTDVQDQKTHCQQVLTCARPQETKGMSMPDTIFALD